MDSTAPGVVWPTDVGEVSDVEVWRESMDETPILLSVLVDLEQEAA